MHVNIRVQRPVYDMANAQYDTYSFADDQETIDFDDLTTYITGTRSIVLHIDDSFGTDPS